MWPWCQCETVWDRATSPWDNRCRQRTGAFRPEMPRWSRTCASSCSSRQTASSSCIPCRCRYTAGSPDLAWQKSPARWLCKESGQDCSSASKYWIGSRLSIHLWFLFCFVFILFARFVNWFEKCEIVSKNDTYLQIVDIGIFRSDLWVRAEQWVWKCVCFAESSTRTQYCNAENRSFLFCFRDVYILRRQKSVAFVSVRRCFLHQIVDHLFKSNYLDFGEKQNETNEKFRHTNEEQ